MVNCEYCNTLNTLNFNHSGENTGKSQDRSGQDGFMAELLKAGKIHFEKQELQKNMEANVSSESDQAKTGDRFRALNLMESHVGLNAIDANKKMILQSHDNSDSGMNPEVETRLKDLHAKEMQLVLGAINAEREILKHAQTTDGENTQKSEIENRLKELDVMAVDATSNAQNTEKEMILFSQKIKGGDAMTHDELNPEEHEVNALSVNTEK